MHPSWLSLLFPVSIVAGGTDRQSVTVDLRAISGKVPGCAAGVFESGQLPRFTSAGDASVAEDIRIGPRTRFAIASMSKQFTALAVLTLAEAGRLNLDDPAAKWLPEMHGAVGDATIRQLLNQTAGVRDHVSLLTLIGIEKLGSIDRQSTLRLMALQRATNFKPGSRADYSNGNFLLLSEIVSRASGMPFEVFAQRRLFAPLMMADTAFLPKRSPAAHGYSRHDDGFVVADDLPATSGSGGLFTTMADLAKFDRDFRWGRRVWTPWVKREMLTEGRLSDGSIATLPQFGTPYGAGVGLQRDGDELWIDHDGAAEGFRADYVRLEKAGVSVAVLCNRDDVDPSSMASAALARAGFARPLPPPKRPAAPTPSRAALSPGQLEELAGRYRSDELAADFRLSPAGSSMAVEIVSSLSPRPVSDTWGNLQAADDAVIISGPLTLHIERGPKGQISGFLLDFGRRARGIRFDRVADREDRLQSDPERH